MTILTDRFTRLIPTAVALLGFFFVCPTASAEIIPQSRRITWQPGVPGGIPNRTTVCADVRTSGAIGDGSHDDAPAIQNAINACPTGQVVFIPAGTYRLNSQLQISKSITLRGSGTASTILKTYANWHGIQLGNFPSTPVATNVTGSPAKGSTTVTVGSVTSPALAVGDYISIDQTNDNVEVVNVDEQCRGGGGTRCLGQITKVTAITGTTLTIDPPLYHSYSSALAPQIWKVSQGTTMTASAGVEDLTLERVSPTGSEGFHNFKLVACAFCWLRNVTSRKTETWHVDLDRTFRCEIRDSFFTDGYTFSGGYSYGVVGTGRTSAALVENNIFYHLRHSMMVKDGATGNVFGYNYSVASYQGEDWLATDMNAHGAHTTMNLWEGNIGAKIYGDFTHGSSSYNTFFRNWSTRDSASQAITNALRAVDIEQSNWYYNVVGNVLGKSGQTWTAYEDPGTRSAGSGKYVYTFGYFSDGQSTSADPQSKATVLRHGNYDYQSNSLKWDAAIADHALPGSLYLSGKPGFFGGLPWPSIGGDVNPVAGTIPAKERYEGRTIPSGGAPQAPSNLRIIE